MKLSKVRLTKDASNRVRFLAGKTGMTPNLLCRLAFCLSLNEAGMPNPNDYPEEEREFNRYTLLGEYDTLFVALLRERCRQDGLGYERLGDYFRAHLNRGVVLLQKRVRGVSDIVELIAAPNGRS